MGVIEKYTEDPLYWLGQRNVMYQTGKLAAHEIAHPVGQSLAESLRSAISPDAAMQLSALGGGFFGKAVGGLVTVGLVSGVSAGLVEFDYHKAKKNLAAAYKEELDAKGLDLNTAAKGDPKRDVAANRTIAEHLAKLKRNRNFGVGFSFIASMAALAAIFVLPVVTKALFNVDLPAAASIFQNHTWEGFGRLALNIVTSLTTYNVIKVPLYWLGEKLFALDRETTHDRIADLQRQHTAGKTISREQVLSVFVKAYPELEQSVSRRFGVSYDDLTKADKQAAAADLGKLVPLDRLTAQINSGETNVTELAFAVEGQMSGVHHDRMDSLKKPGRLHSMWTKVCDKLGCRFQPKPEFAGMPMLQMPAAAPADYEEDKPKRSFVQGLGRAKLDSSMGYTKLLEQVDKQPNSPYPQTIQ